MAFGGNPGLTLGFLEFRMHYSIRSIPRSAWKSLDSKTLQQPTDVYDYDTYTYFY